MSEEIETKTGNGGTVDEGVGEAMVPVPRDVTALPGLEDVGLDDMIVPRLRIVQPTSSEMIEAGARVGTFCSNVSGECCESLRMVLLTERKGRVLFPVGAERPRCASDDGFAPSPRIEEPISEACGRKHGGRFQATCAMAQWSGRTPPECRDTYTLLD